MLNINSRKLIRAMMVGLGFTAFLWLILYFYLLPHYSNVPKNDNVFIGTESSEELRKKLKFKDMKSPLSSFESTQDTSKEVKRSAADIAIVNAWLKRVGYSDDTEAYKGYSDAVLEELSNKGDIVALHLLGSKKLAQGDIEGSKKYAESGVVFGSLNSIKAMASFNYPSFTSTPESAKPALIETLAYYQLLKIRGESHDAELDRKNLIRMFEESYKITQVLSDDDEKTIAKRGAELYQQYESQRIKLGLGNFDNEVPKEVKDFYETK